MEAESIQSLTPLINQADQWREVLLLLPLLVALEAVLSADNAIALAAIARGLEDPARQRQALNLGLALALVFRLGLIVAAQYALARGATVGILDGDAHYGDGTQQIIDKLGLDIIAHRTVGADFPVGQPVSGYIDWWHDAVEEMRGLDVVLYQAGADPHEQDPLGGQVSSTMLALRDRLVFEGLPNVAWNLAGGYGPATMNIHTSTLMTCLVESAP